MVGHSFSDYNCSVAEHRGGIFWCTVETSILSLWMSPKPLLVSQKWANWICFPLQYVHIFNNYLSWKVESHSQKLRGILMT